MIIGADIVANNFSSTFENQLMICSSAHRFCGNEGSSRVLVGQIESSLRILNYVCCVVWSQDSRFIVPYGSDGMHAKIAVQYGQNGCTTL